MRRRRRRYLRRSFHLRLRIDERTTRRRQRGCGIDGVARRDRPGAGAASGRLRQRAALASGRCCGTRASRRGRVRNQRQPRHRPRPSCRRRRQRRRRRSSRSRRSTICRAATKPARGRCSIRRWVSIRATTSRARCRSRSAPTRRRSSARCSSATPSSATIRCRSSRSSISATASGSTFWPSTTTWPIRVGSPRGRSSRFRARRRCRRPPPRRRAPERPGHRGDHGGTVPRSPRASEAAPAAAAGGDLAALMQKGRRLQASGDVQGAYAAFSEAVARAPGNRDAILQRDAATVRAHPQLRSRGDAGVPAAEPGPGDREMGQAARARSGQSEGEARARARHRAQAPDEREVRHAQMTHRDFVSRSMRFSLSSAARASCSFACARRLPGS